METLKPAHEAQQRARRAAPDQFHVGLGKLPTVMSRLGYSGFKSRGQQEAVYNLLLGRDTVCILPTGGGKTAVALIPALCLGWRVLIFSPLKALMQDMVKNLSGMGCRAAAVNSSQSPAENNMIFREWAAGNVDVLLVAPERIHSEYFWEVIGRTVPDLVVVDEAHVGSEWSDSFRPEYARLGAVIDKVQPKLVLALTATAPRPVMRDIQRLYGLHHADLIVDMPRRDNLILSSSGLFARNAILDRIKAPSKRPAIVYCSTQKNVEMYFQLFDRALDERAAPYHGGMQDNQRQANLNDFLRGRVTTMFATNAFGMGVDKADIRSVIHADIPPSLENLAQEIGRGGRDGKPCQCHLFLHEEGIRIHEFLNDQTYPETENFWPVFQYIWNESQKGTQLVKRTAQEIGDAVGIKHTIVQSVMLALVSIGAFERSNETNSPYRFSNIDWVALSAHNAKVAEALRGVMGRDPMSPQVMTAGKDALHAALKKVTGKRLVREAQSLLGTLQAKGFFAVEFPFRGATTRVVNPDAFFSYDWDVWERKRAVVRRKLREVREYAETPDEEKHAFLDAYFLMQ